MTDTQSSPIEFDSWNKVAKFIPTSVKALDCTDNPKRDAVMRLIFDVMQKSIVANPAVEECSDSLLRTDLSNKYELSVSPMVELNNEQEADFDSYDAALSEFAETLSFEQLKEAVIICAHYQLTAISGMVTRAAFTHLHTIPTADATRAALDMPGNAQFETREIETMTKVAVSELLTLEQLNKALADERASAAETKEPSGVTDAQTMPVHRALAKFAKKAAIPHERFTLQIVRAMDDDIDFCITELLYQKA